MARSEYDKDREACEEATKGPWNESGRYTIGRIEGNNKPKVATAVEHADAAFISRARNRWEAALDVVEAVQTYLEHGDGYADLVEAMERFEDSRDPGDGRVKQH